MSHRPLAVSLVAVAVRALALLIIVELVGAKVLGQSFSHLRVGWIAVVAAGELLTYPAYVVAYRSVSRMGRRTRLGVATVTRIVVAGFGPVAVSGGFTVDRNALQAFDEGDASARLHVGAMATLEWAVLAPVTCVVAIVLLVTGADVSGTLLWPWALGLPAGIAFAVWASVPARRERLVRRHNRGIELIAHALEGVAAVKVMAAAPRRYAGAWSGIALYWLTEVCALYAALRAAGLDLGIVKTVLAYATGYLASRRSLPLGGAGLVEALLIYSLYSLREPQAASVDAVMIYRVFNFLCVVIPALIAYRGLPAATQAQLAVLSVDEQR